jgi:hypothetical protein
MTVSQAECGMKTTDITVSQAECGMKTTDMTVSQAECGMKTTDMTVTDEQHKMKQHVSLYNLCQKETHERPTSLSNSRFHCSNCT